MNTHNKSGIPTINAQLIALALTLCSEACSSGLRKNDYALHHLFLQNVQMRRPVQAAADPNSEWGDRSYESHPKPNARLDCTPFEEPSQRLQTLRQCIAGLGREQPPPVESKESKAPREPLRAIYRLNRESSPRLELVEPELAPPCLKDSLKEIAVPREIFFQSNAGPTAEIQCYSSRLPLRSDDNLGLKSWLTRFEIVIHFPLEHPPGNNEETLTLLKTWAIAPFWNSEKQAVIGKVVPDNLCRICMGGDQNLIQSQKITGNAAPPEWPARPKKSP